MERLPRRFLFEDIFGDMTSALSHTDILLKITPRSKVGKTCRSAVCRGFKEYMPWIILAHFLEDYRYSSLDLSGLPFRAKCRSERLTSWPAWQHRSPRWKEVPLGRVEIQILGRKAVRSTRGTCSSSFLCPQSCRDPCIKGEGDPGVSQVGSAWTCLDASGDRRGWHCDPDGLESWGRQRAQVMGSTQSYRCVGPPGCGMAGISSADIYLSF